MNIFTTNVCPIISAQELCDKHVRSKMIIESAIMLQHCFDNSVLASAPKTKKGKFRKSGGGYFNHPCSVWVRESKANAKWLLDHALEMCRERLYRWPDSESHFTQEFLVWVQDNFSKAQLPDLGLTPFAVAINDTCKCRSLPNFDSLSTIEKYQKYIVHDKPFAVWTKRQKPSWY